MEERLPPELEPSLEDQIRALGFDPSHLTALEQHELVEMYTLYPDEALTA